MRTSRFVKGTSLERDLIRFILARIEDDERELKRLVKSPVQAVRFPSLDRLSVESAAKREMISALQRLLVLRDLPSERPVREGATEVLRRMALPYDDHAGYRAEWRPKRSGV